jgi:hypothetical protein
VFPGGGEEAVDGQALVCWNADRRTEARLQFRPSVLPGRNGRKGEWGAIPSGLPTGGRSWRRRCLVRFQAILLGKSHPERSAAESRRCEASALGVNLFESSEVDSDGAPSLTNALSAGCGERSNPKRPIECAVDAIVLGGWKRWDTF